MWPLDLGAGVADGRGDASLSITLSTVVPAEEDLFKTAPAWQHMRAIGPLAGLMDEPPVGAAVNGGGDAGDAPPSNEEEPRLEQLFILKQQRWLLFLRHGSKCKAALNNCPYTPHCHVARALWEHVLSCKSAQCNYPRCVSTKQLLRHHQRCRDAHCPVCEPVRKAMQKELAALLFQEQDNTSDGGWVTEEEEEAEADA
jgi:TAZ zinc finger